MSEKKAGENTALPETDAKKKRKHPVLKCLLVILAVIVVAVGAAFAWGYHTDDTLSKSFYQVQTSKISQNIRIVQLSDLHLKTFGTDNATLVEQVKALNPDLIVFTGDMTEWQNYDYSVVTKLIEDLSQVCQVVYSYGNNEYDQLLFEDATITKQMENAGALVLSNESTDIEVNGSTLSVCGLSENPTSYDKYEKGREVIAEFTKSDNFKLLLDHYPEHYLKGQLNDESIDLTLSGHTHGGQVVLPFVGALYTSDQGFLPKLVSGQHVYGSTTLIISRGLGNDSWIPRIGNPPEIVVVDLLAL